MRPIWLANISLSLDQAVAERDWRQYAADLLWMCPRANAWLDEHVIKGSAANRRIAEEVQAHLRRLACFELIQPPFGGLRMLRDTAVRFVNVLKQLEFSGGSYKILPEGIDE